MRERPVVIDFPVFFRIEFAGGDVKPRADAIRRRRHGAAFQLKFSR